MFEGLNERVFKCSVLPSLLGYDCLLTAKVQAFLMNDNKRKPGYNPMKINES
jgi:hypothetical protein